MLSQQTITVLIRKHMMSLVHSSLRGVAVCGIDKNEQDPSS